MLLLLPMLCAAAEWLKNFATICFMGCLDSLCSATHVTQMQPAATRSIMFADFATCAPCWLA
jgi:hypothetical protein